MLIDKDPRYASALIDRLDDELLKLQEKLDSTFDLDSSVCPSEAHDEPPLAGFKVDRALPSTQPLLLPAGQIFALDVWVKGPQPLCLNGVVLQPGLAGVRLLLSLLDSEHIRTQLELEVERDGQVFEVGETLACHTNYTLCLTALEDWQVGRGLAVPSPGPVSIIKSPLNETRA
jgi:hypothetical protein